MLLHRHELDGGVPCRLDPRQHEVWKPEENVSSGLQDCAQAPQ